jgi:hypothetical protein
MLDRETLLSQLPMVFPPQAWEGDAAPHGCEECSAMSEYLRGKSWADVEGNFVDEYEGSLPLLSPTAYHAFLPAWLRWCIVAPVRQAVGTLLVNLECQEELSLFTDPQKSLVRDAACFIIANNGWGDDDEGNIEARANIRGKWCGADT